MIRVFSKSSVSPHGQDALFVLAMHVMHEHADLARWYGEPFRALQGALGVFVAALPMSRIEVPENS